jgi:hypothetical protein
MDAVQENEPMLRAIVLIALGAAAAVAFDRLVLAPASSVTEGPPVATTDPAPGSPPLVWVEGTLVELTPGSLTVRDGEGPAVELDRAAAGATRFFLLDGPDWATVPDEEVDGMAAGQGVCVEALMDGRTLLALRVFLGAGCAPAPTGVPS